MGYLIGRPVPLGIESCEAEAGRRRHAALPENAPLLDFQQLPIWGNVLVFIGSASVIWFAGFRLAIYGDAIAERKRLSRAFFGALFLGIATSLPEIATTVTAAAIGNAQLAVSNLMGGVTAQVAVLAFIDLLFVRGALTFFAPRPVLLMSGVLLMFQLALTLAAIAAGEVASLWGVGLWPVLLMTTYVASVYTMYHYEGRNRWTPVDLPDDAYQDEAADSDPTSAETLGSTHRLYGLFCLTAAVVFVAGWSTSSASDALAMQTGLGSSFFGATFLAIATSLPEISTTAGAVRVGAYTMAVANIFGTNSLESGLLLLTDIVYREGLVVDQVARSSQFIAAVGILLTCIYLWGLLERRDKTFLGMGIDSALVLTTWLASLVVLYSMA